MAADVALADAADHLLVAVRGAAALMYMAAMTADEPHEWLGEAMVLAQGALERVTYEAEGVIRVPGAPMPEGGDDA